MNTQAKILIVDDDEAITGLLREVLQTEGFATHECLSGQEALAALSAGGFDLVLLDVMMPGMNGFETCQRIREDSDVPVVFLTARNEESDAVLGFSLGADDYIVKPFDMKELVARIKAVLRRFQNADAPASKELSFPGLTINIGQYTVTYMGKELEMPPKELELLYFLASHPGMVFTREQLLEQVWGYDYFGDSRTVDVHVKRLREKLTDGEKMGWQIKTVWGVGYKFEVK